jgi:subtilisin family serine protease
MAEIVDDQFPQSPPNDPTYPNQQNLTLQRIDEAWQTLHNADEDLSLGSPEIYVASLDRGVQTDHPDVNGNLTDGTPQIAHCFDFNNMRSCTDPGYAPSTNHGMGVYGIIAARTNNQTAVAGIAPNTRQIGMERPNLTSVNYPDVLLWAAGLTTGNTDPDWPDEPLNPGAAIINCSHGRNGLALSGIMDDTFKTLTDNGRDGLGTIVVYSAGNDNEVITGFRTWAAHSRTLAIANSLQPNNAGVETKANSSNYGPEIDVCAQGQGAPSLDDNGGERNFGGTSAAAPTVAAVAALMLSLVPTLSWEIVRNILRETAVKIDPQNNDPAGRWEDKEGRVANHPSYSGPHFSQWYGYGRIDAQEAVSYFSGCADAFSEFIKKLLSGKWN